MKLVKMSLVAAMVMGASAFAIDNVKVSGDAKLFYGTDDSGTASLMDQGSSYADTALRLGVAGDLTKGVSFGVTGIAVSTLGLENNLVANTWTGAHTAGNGVNDAMWVSEAWLAATMGKTTVKIGRMELDTPFAFSEKWSVAANSFDAAVLINQDLPDTTLVGAWVGKGNGINALGNVENRLNTTVGTPYTGNVPFGTVGGYDNLPAVGVDGIVGTGFGTFMNKGAYAVAAVNNSFKPLTAQAWYYNVVNVADAYWLQADINCQLVKDLKIGAQYANMSPKGLLKAAGFSDDSSAYAFKLGYEGIKNLKVSAAYSDTDKDGTLKIANVATNHLTSQSKLYTEAFWNYGYVGAPGAESYNVTAEYDAGIAKIGAYYTSVSNENDVNFLRMSDMNEMTLTASKSFGPLDATLAYVSTDADDQNAGSQYNTVQAYLTLNF